MRRCLHGIHHEGATVSPRRATEHAVLIASVIATTVALANFARPAVATTKRCFGAVPTIRGTAGSDRIEGTDGPDVIVVGGGNDIVNGGEGDDRICGGRGSDSLFGEGGADRLGTGRGRKKNAGRNIAIGGAGDDILVGGPANDQFSGGGGDDVLRGRGGPDLMYAGDYGTNRLVGGKGGDLVQYLRRNWVVHVNLTRGIGKSKGRDRLSGVENVTANGPARLIGDDKPNYLAGGVNADTLLGRGGDDCLAPGDGENAVWGNAGVDAYTASPSDRCGTVAPGAGTPIITPGVVVDLETGEAEYGGTTSTLHGIESAYGTREEDQISGDENTNVLYGGGAADELHGRGGDDRLDGGSGTDTLDGGEGTDSCLNGEAVVSCE
jgi:Ca2+-binding RTX toxin-like protein